MYVSIGRQSIGAGNDLNYATIKPKFYVLQTLLSSFIIYSLTPTLANMDSLKKKDRRLPGRKPRELGHINNQPPVEAGSTSVVAMVPENCGTYNFKIVHDPPEPVVE